MLVFQCTLVSYAKVQIEWNRIGVVLKEIMMKILCGAAIGVGFVLPGVSGGVIAISMGLYEKMLSAIKRMLTFSWKAIKESFLFLLPIGIGGVIGVLLTSNVLKLVIEQHEAEVLALFCGFVLGSIPTLFEETRLEGQKKLSVKSVLLMVAGFGFAVLFGFLDTSATTEAAATAGHALPPLLAMLSGGVLAIGVVIPGLSSSFLLVYLGLYKAILVSIAELYIPTLFFAALGFGIAALLLVLMMHSLLEKYHAASYFAIIGVAVGSMMLILPQVMAGFTFWCIPLLIIGAAFGLWQSIWQIRRTRAQDMPTDSAGEEN